MKGKKMLGVLINLYGSWQSRHEASVARKQTIRELSRLTDYELNDIGLSRGEIKYVAQSHYRDIVEENKAKERVYTYSNGNLKGWV
jgi:uncharacterized protein YjiS (DUF1127 family)